MSPDSQPTPSENNEPTPSENSEQLTPDTTNPFEAVTPSTVTTFSVPPAPEAASVAPGDMLAAEDSTALSLYVVTVFSGISVLWSSSYLVWNVVDYFTKPQSASFFDLSSFTIYAMIYLVVFATLYALASMRLDARAKQAGALGRQLRTVGAIWRAVLVFWGVVSLVGLAYSPISAATDGDFSSLPSEITSSVISLVIIGLFFWRDLFVPKLRSGMVAVGVIAGLALLIAGANAYASFNPKEPEQDPYDYSSSMYDY